MVATCKIDSRRKPRLHEDRRVFPRRALAMHVTGRRLGRSMDAHREPCLYLTIQDVSAGGLCAVSQTHLNLGEHIAVFFPPEAGGRGWDACGCVVRVEPDRLGWRIGVRLDRAAAD